MHLPGPGPRCARGPLTSNNIGRRRVHPAIPAWLDTDPARDRTYVWVAMGRAISQFGLSATDAIASLRSFAYGHDRLLDDVATEW